MEEKAQAVALYSGTVQGVGFRYTARRMARGFDVAGHVRNRPDGRVEVVAEGRREEVGAFLKAVQTAMDFYIDRVDVRWGKPSGAFKGFEVAF